MSPGKDAEESDGSGAGGFLEDLPTLALAIAIALFIRTFAFQSFYVPSDSMFPTLLIGDHVFVTKLAYGSRVPGTEVRAPGYRDAARGDVVVFQLARGGRKIYPPDHRPDLPTEAFIKRLVGLPGDTIEIRDGIVWIDGRESPQTPTGEKFTDPSGRTFDILEERLGECRHLILNDPRIPPANLPKLQIPEDRYFFLGDNRDNSYDSRMWGTAPLSSVEGPAGLLYWSWDWTGSWLSLLNPLTWWTNLTQKMRWGRMGDVISCLPPAGPVAD